MSQDVASLPCLLFWMLHSLTQKIQFLWFNRLDEKEEFIVEFHKILKEKRKELGLTQEQLAKQLMVSRSAISNWEIGRNYPDIQSLITIANIFDVSLDYLFNEDIEISKAIDSEVNKNKKFKLISIFLTLLVIVMACVTIYLFLTKQPTVVFKEEILPQEMLVENFSKNEINDIRLVKDELYITVTSNPTDLSYYVESFENELSINLYHSKSDRKTENENLSYESIIKINLSNHSLSNINKIIVYGTN